MVCVSKNADLARRNTLSLACGANDGKVDVDLSSAITLESEFLTGDKLERRSVGICLLV